MPAKRRGEHATLARSRVALLTAGLKTVDVSVRRLAENMVADGLISDRQFHLAGHLWQILGDIRTMRRQLVQYYRDAHQRLTGPGGAMADGYAHHYIGKSYWGVDIRPGSFKDVDEFLAGERVRWTCIIDVVTVCLTALVEFVFGTCGILV